MQTRTGSRSLPFYASTLFGREQELALLENLVADEQVRLITLTGTAGIGKTRIASHFARSHAGESVQFVNLATIRDHTLVIPAIARALDIHCDDLIEGTRQMLSSWEGLLVIDNFEQVIDAALDIAEILPQNPNLTVVITSQRPLQIEGERIIRLVPLAVPDPESHTRDFLDIPSVALLIDRAKAQDSSAEDLMQSESATLAIAEICRKLDGIPLALELAASRLAILSPEAVLSQLERGGSVLSSHRRDAPERQRTMHAAIAWSYQLLPDELRQLFLWLGPFTAGFNLEIVERIAAHLGVEESSFEIVSELVDSSLIIRVSGGADPWYSMLVSIREFCLHELDAHDEREAAEEQVARYLLELTAPGPAGLSSSVTPTQLIRLEQNFPTIRSAIRWALAHDSPSLPLKLGFRLPRFLEQTGRWREGVQWIESAATLSEPDLEDERIAALIGMLELQSAGRDIEGASATHSKLISLFDRYELPRLQALFLTASGGLEVRKHQLEQGESNYLLALEMSQALGMDHNLARTRANLGFLKYLQGDFDRATELLNLGATGLRAVGDIAGVSTALQHLAHVANLQNKMDQALNLTEESIELAREHNLTLDLIHSLVIRIALLAGLGNYDEAISLAEEPIELATKYNQPALAADTLHMLGAMSLERNDCTGVGNYFHRAFQLTNIDATPRMYAEMGIYTASALAKTARYSDAAMILGGYDAFVANIEYHLRPDQMELRSEIESLLNQHLENANEAINAGQTLLAAEWESRLKRSARTLARQGSVMLVKVAAPTPQDLLTNREREVLQLLLDGGTTQRMADELSLSPRTVTTHIGNIMAKMEVSSRAELIAKVMRNPSH